jgi:hypothetical protein
MRFRQGFVSNSSTTSFCIYGTQIFAKDGIDLDEVILEGLRNFGNNPNYGSDYEPYIGVSLTDIEDDQTLFQFKQMVQDRFIHQFGEEFVMSHPLSICEDAWYDG